MTPATELSWTGERYTPEVPGENAMEHLHRYAIACQLAKDRRVLDVACGEGYGARLLAAHAASVLGADIDTKSVAHANVRYAQSNLDFVQADCTALPLPDACIDLAVSFETLEHHDKQDAMLAELRRVLAPGGILILSTPDRLNYSDRRHYANPFHVHELYEDEFKALIGRYFPHAVYFDQRVVYGSLIVPRHARGRFHTHAGDSTQLSQSDGLIEPLYLIALASPRPLPELPASVFDATARWKGEHPELVHELLATRHQLDTMRASIYWRITYPLRLARRLVRQLIGY